MYETVFPGGAKQRNGRIRYGRGSVGASSQRLGLILVSEGTQCMNQKVDLSCCTQQDAQSPSARTMFPNVLFTSFLLYLFWSCCGGLRPSIVENRSLECPVLSPLLFPSSRPCISGEFYWIWMSLFQRPFRWVRETRSRICVPLRNYICVFQHEPSVYPSSTVA